jgi:hypothetical protein
MLTKHDKRLSMYLFIIILVNKSKITEKCKHRIAHIPGELCLH